MPRYIDLDPSKPADAVAEACGLLNDHELPNVLALTRALVELVRLVEIMDPHAVDDARVRTARQHVDALRPHFPSNV